MFSKFIKESLVDCKKVQKIDWNFIGFYFFGDYNKKRELNRYTNRGENHRSTTYAIVLTKDEMFENVKERESNLWCF